MSGLTCATAPGVEFSSYDDLKQHYKTDWHRYNLKRKVAGLPMVSLDLFERVVNHATALQESAERPASKAHLKADKERRRPSTRRARLELDDSELGSDFDHEEEGQQAGGDSDWEEVEGDEASALMMELDARMAGSRAQRAAADSAVAKDEEMEEESDEADDDSELLALAAQSHISLAQNGFELRVGQRILGAREFAQFYRQRHRPADRREVALVANNARERGMVLRGGANAPAAKIKVPKQQAMDQRREQRSQAWLRMKVQMSTNGPMFRGHREA